MEVPVFSVALLCAGTKLRDVLNRARVDESFVAGLTYGERSQWETRASLLILIGVVLLIIWVFAYIRYQKKSRVEWEKSCRELYSLVLEGDMKRLVFLDGDYASELSTARAAFVQTKHWACYEPRLVDVVLNKSDLNNMMDIMLARRGKIRSDAVLNGYSVGTIDQAARIEFLQVIRATLGAWGVARHLVAIQNRDSGEVVRYAWSETPAAECDHFERCVALDRLTDHGKL